MSETNNETAVRSRTTREESQGEAPLAPLVPGNEDPNRPLVELTHVEKHFGDLHVLKDINMTVTKGEVGGGGGRGGTGGGKGGKGGGGGGRGESGRKWVREG